MCIIYRILLLIACFGIFIDCQGAGGGRGGNILKYSRNFY